MFLQNKVWLRIFKNWWWSCLISERQKPKPRCLINCHNQPLVIDQMVLIDRSALLHTSRKRRIAIDHQCLFHIPSSSFSPNPPKSLPKSLRLIFQSPRTRFESISLYSKTFYYRNKIVYWFNWQTVTNYNIYINTSI